MKKALLFVFLLALASNVLADVLCEAFDDPLGGWRTRWLALNSDMRNYYVCYGGSNEDDRGNNPCGLWICDGDGNAMQADVEFLPTFGATVTHFELGIMPFVPADFAMYAPGGGLIYSTSLVVDGTFPPCPTRVYGANTPIGLASFSIIPMGGSQIEGNTSVDNVCATTGVVPAEESTWGSIKSMYR